MLSFLLFLPFLSSLALANNAFAFTHSAPSQCGPLNVTWTGGSGSGYYLSVVPEFGIPRNISIPSTNTADSFATTLALNASDRFVLSLSDSSGFGAGGVTPLLQVDQGDSSCNLTRPGLPFTFIDTEMQQCLPYTMSQYLETGAIAPVTVYGLIPGGDPFVLHPTTKYRTFSWDVTIYNDTNVIIYMVDAGLRQGGSILKIVQISSSFKCINSTSPSSTALPGATSSPSSTSLPSSNGGTPIGAIVGSALGGLIFLAVFITLGLFFLRQRQENSKAKRFSATGLRHHSYPFSTGLSSISSSLAMEHSTLTGSGTRAPSRYQASQYSTSAHGNPDPFNPEFHVAEVEPFMEQNTLAPVPSLSQRKLGMSAGPNRSLRYVLHTDSEDHVPSEDEEVVELPPQYSASRRPAQIPEQPESHSA